MKRLPVTAQERPSLLVAELRRAGKGREEKKEASRINSACNSPPSSSLLILLLFLSPGKKTCLANSPSRIFRRGMHAKIIRPTDGRWIRGGEMEEGRERGPLLCRLPPTTPTVGERASERAGASWASASFRISSPFSCTTYNNTEKRRKTEEAMTEQSGGEEERDDWRAGWWAQIHLGGREKSS